MTILVATWADGLFVISGNECVQEIAGQPVRGLTVDGHGGALAIVGGHSLHRRTPGGDWAAVVTSDFELSCCLAVQDTIFAGTDNARMLRLRADGVLDPIDAFDNMAGRGDWFAGSAVVNARRVGPPLGVRSVAANSSGSVLFANVHVGGVPRSVDGGKSWHPTLDINWDVHEVRAHPSNSGIAAAAAAVGLCISRDAGATWTVENKGLHAPHCSAVAFSGDDIIFSASTDPFAAEGRIYRRPLNPAGCISAVEVGVEAWINGIADTGCIAAAGPLVAVADRAGNLYLSEDFGRTWSCRRKGLPPPSGVMLCQV